jgi:SAM-dependent methyltransferase
MRLTDITTGSHAPKRIGSYEKELHSLIESFSGYDRVINVGCGEGYYVVGLARRMRDADMWGFDIAASAREACRRMAEANAVRVHVHGEATPGALDELVVTDRTLIIVDAEGAEVDVLDPSKAPKLHGADLLVELHDFLRPGATDVLLRRFPYRRPCFIIQQPRRASDYPMLASLSDSDAERAMSESRPRDQRWLWMPVDAS